MMKKNNTKEHPGKFFIKAHAIKEVFPCVLLECFAKFLFNPYYEPLSWFMIRVIPVIAFPSWGA